MSNLVICNRCQELFKQENTTWGEVKGFWSEDIELDLCNDCKEELDEWLHPVETKKLKDWTKKGK